MNKMTNKPYIVSARDMIDSDVVNDMQEDLGKIEDVVLDPVNHRIAYAVLSFGGILGMGGKYFAIPWEALSYNNEENHYVLNIDKERLENAEGFDKDNWPDMANPAWGEQIYGYYGYKPYWL